MFHNPIGHHRFGAVFFAEVEVMNFVQAGRSTTQGICRLESALELGHSRWSGQ